MGTLITTGAVLVAISANPFVGSATLSVTLSATSATSPTGNENLCIDSGLKIGVRTLGTMRNVSSVWRNGTHTLDSTMCVESEGRRGVHPLGPVRSLESG